MREYLDNIKRLGKKTYVLLFAILLLVVANIVAVTAMTHRTAFVSRGQTSGGCGTITVSNVTQLVNAVNVANSTSGCSTTIVLADGTYTLSDLLPINATNVTVKSQSGDRTKVILQGDAMSEGASVKEIFRVAASHFTVQDITMQRVGWHLLQVVGENNADSITVRNCVFRDAYQQLMKVSYVDSNMAVGSDNGVVENSLFEYSAGVGPAYYIGGIDAHNAKNWVIRGNTFKNIISPDTSVAEFAIHFWSSSADTLVEKNLIVNSDRGIGFGLTEDRGHTGGIIRNNMIYHAAGNGAFADVGIAATADPNVQIYNNTVFMENNYPDAIEYRYGVTSNVLIVNNLTNKAIVARDGASGTVGNNTTNAVAGWFVNAAAGDLHVTAAATAVVDSGQAVAGLSDDFDAQARPSGAGIDRGADEMGGTAGPIGNPTAVLSPSLALSPTPQVPTPTSMYATPTTYCLGACPTPAIAEPTSVPGGAASAMPTNAVAEPTAAPEGQSGNFLQILLGLIAAMLSFLLKALQMRA